MFPFYIFVVMNVNYFLKDGKKAATAVYAVVRFRGARYKFYPGVTVETGAWDASRRRAKTKGNPGGPAVNIILDRFESRIKAAFEPYILSREAPTPKQIKTALADEASAPASKAAPYFTDYFRHYYENADYKRETWKKYNTAYNWLTKYEQRTGQRLTFESINTEFYAHFKMWMLGKKYRPRPGEIPRHYSINYFGSLIKCVKKVMADTGPDSRAQLHRNTQYRAREFKTLSEPADSIYLSMEELMKLHRFTATPGNISEITDDPRRENLQRKADAINLSKNKFLIGCFTALRVSDFNRLDEVNIDQGYISIKPRKGLRKNENVIIPIHPVVKEILATGFNVSAPISGQKLNKHIKEAARLVGITSPVTTARTEGGSLVERTAPKWQKVSTHTARRSGASNMYLAGIPSISIMKITGHTTEASFLRYIRISQEENARLLAGHPFFK